MSSTQLKLDKNDDILIKNIRRLMHLHGLNEAELARKTAIPQSTLHKILSGFTADPRVSNLRVLADYFAVPLDTLFKAEPWDETAKNYGIASLSLPIISWCHCVDKNFYPGSLSPKNWNDWIVVERNSNTNGNYGLVTKPSMEPRFPRGTILIIDNTTQAHDGDLIVVQYPEAEDATIRELAIDGREKLLLPLNKNFLPR